MPTECLKFKWKRGFGFGPLGMKFACWKYWIRVT